MRLAKLLLSAAFLTPLLAQDITLPPNIEKLAASAEESVNDSLDGPMLQLAARFMSGRDSHEAAVRKLLTGLKGIYVRSYQFNRDGAYSDADLESFRSQFRSPEWSRIVGVRSRREKSGDGDEDNADIYIRATASGQLGGIAILAAEPRELTIVNVVGTIDPADVAELGGEFGIPRMSFKHARRESEPQ